MLQLKLPHKFIINASVIIWNTDRTEILLTRRSLTEDFSAGKYSIPGGKIEYADKTIEEGLQREVEEEVGLDINEISYIKNHMGLHNNTYYLYVVYSALFSGGTVTMSSEVDYAEWFSPLSIPSKSKFTPNTFEIIKSACIRKS